MRGGIEAGGTKFVCAVGSGPQDLDTEVLPTTTPAETLDQVVSFFRARQGPGRRLLSLGVASFGPLDLRRGSPTFGTITTTPKPGWTGTDLLGMLQAELGVPVQIDTDVNGAALGESRWGATQGLGTSTYLTVGTGIGGGNVVAGRPQGGWLHPEMGHLAVRRHPEDDFPGTCRFHGDCLEGLASGPALRARFGRPPETLGAELRRAVQIESWYLSQLVTAVLYVLGPDRIVLGGGVLGMPGLLDAVRQATVDRLAGALDPSVVDIDSYLVPPALDRWSGVLGALALVERSDGDGDELPAQRPEPEPSLLLESPTL